MLIKVDAEGRELWSSTYGGEKTDRIFSVRQTADGGFVSAGITYSFGAVERNAYLLKVDGKGKMDWQRSGFGVLGAYTE